jgi:hypothetical protein
MLYGAEGEVTVNAELVVVCDDTDNAVVPEFVKVNVPARLCPTTKLL